MALWNQKNLAAPPTNSYKSKTNNLDLLKLRNALQDCINHFKNEDFLMRESALLARILYRMKMKFRSSKEFKSLEKINRSLNIYLNANMGRDLRNIFDSIPTKYLLETYLPTRNMLSYILVRIQGLVKLMERVYDTCLVAATEINNRIAIGHFWKIYVVLFALVSRIYILVKFNTKLLCELYGKLLPHSNKLENTGRNWLPEGYDLPGDLREWLGVQWVYEEEFIDLTFEPSMKILDFFDLVDDDDDDEVQFCDEYVLVDTEDINIANDFKKLRPVQETFTRNRMRGFSINEDDIGEDLADIIKLNDTILETISPEDKKSDKEMGSHSNDINNKLAVEDIGEEISGIENNCCDDRIPIINLDKTECNLNASVNKMNTFTEDNEINIKKSRKKKSKNKNNTGIILADNSVILKDSEVIVIQETPAKETNTNLEDTSVIVLDDTVVNSSVSSKTINKNIKKKKKRNKIKKALQYSSPIINNSMVNIISENKHVSVHSGSTFISSHDSNSEKLQIPSIKNEETIFKQLNDKTKSDGNSNVSTDKRNDLPDYKSTGKKKRKRDDEITATDFTKYQDQKNNDSNPTAVNKGSSKKKKKANKGKNANSNKIQKFNDSEYEEFTATLSKIDEILGRNKKPKKSKKNKKNQSAQFDKKENIVCLTLVQEIPNKNKEPENQKEVSASLSRSEHKRLEANKYKASDAKQVNLKLIPCLDSPLIARLNFDKETMNKDRASSCTVTSQQNISNVPLETVNKILKTKIKIDNEDIASTSRVMPEQNVSNMSLEMVKKIIKTENEAMASFSGVKPEQNISKISLEMLEKPSSMTVRNRKGADMASYSTVTSEQNGSRENMRIPFFKRKYKEKCRYEPKSKFFRDGSDLFGNSGKKDRTTTKKVI